jgi:hypothetical protein
MLDGPWLIAKNQSSVSVSVLANACHITCRKTLLVWVVFCQELPWVTQNGPATPRWKGSERPKAPQQPECAAHAEPPAEPSSFMAEPRVPPPLAMPEPPAVSAAMQNCSTRCSHSANGPYGAQYCEVSSPPRSPNESSLALRRVATGCGAGVGVRSHFR